MRKFLLFLLFLSAVETLIAQHVHTNRCGTGAVMENYFNKFPQYRKTFEARQKEFQLKALQKEIGRGAARMQAALQIPVVFHVLTSSPGEISDAQLLGQLKIINDDFGGWNADSTKIPLEFKPRYGKSTISFCLAQRNPDGEPTTGINRKVYTGGASPGVGDPVKYAAFGGADAWDTRRYLNIWIVEISGGTLGYSFLPGTPGLPAAEMGLVLNVRFTGNSGTATAPFNLGRTATHELGHFFGLQHIWGASQNSRSCTDSDGVADTPNQDTANFGTPSFPKTDACTPSAPGVMFMNYMDYVNDAAMMMFTHGQVNVMETVLGSSSDRNGLPTSDACQPAVALALDARLKAVKTPSPGASVCAGSLSPLVVIRNAGSTLLTAVTLNYTLNNGAVQSTTFPVNLSSFTETTLALNALTIPVGAHVLQVYLASPNGGADENTGNDTLNIAFTAVNPGSLPIQEGFESGTLPSGWVFQTSGATNWQITGAAAKTGNSSVYFSNFNADEPGKYADLVLVPVQISGYDSLSLRFSVAAAVYNSAFLDTLQVLVSTNCGASFTSVYKKWGNSLATAPPDSDEFFPNASQWREESIDLSSFRNHSTLQVIFRNINQFGNNIFLDDIGLNGFVITPNDAALAAVSSPVERLCTPDISPLVTLKNHGSDTLRSVQIQYRIDNGAIQTINWTAKLGRFDTTPIQLPTSGVTPGTHELTAWTLLPNGVADENPLNDTLKRTFTRLVPMQLPLSEGFENSSFPPANWVVKNQPQSAVTWARTTAAAYNGSASAFIHNFNQSEESAEDELVTPLVQFGITDSVYLSFRIAARAGPSSLPDYFSVQITKDCGLHYEEVYRKTSIELAMPGNDGEGEFIPSGKSNWRRDSVNLTPFLAQSNAFYLVFRNINNFGNNIYLDDVQIYTRDLPLKLKEEGLLVAPTLVNNHLLVQHYRQPADLRFIRLLNAAGQQVYNRSFNGNASSYIEMNLGYLPAGVYFVQLGYTDRQVTKKIVKTP